MTPGRARSAAEPRVVPLETAPGGAREPTVYPLRYEPVMNLPCRLSGPIWPGFRIVISPERVGARAAGPTNAAAVTRSESIAAGGGER